VRDFGIDFAIQPTTPRQFDWSGNPVTILAGEEDLDVAGELSRELIRAGAKANVVAFAAARSDAGPPIAGGWRVVVLPRQAGGGGREGLMETMRRLRAAIPQANDKLEGVALVQWGCGLFGLGPIGSAPETCSAAAFARTLSLEQPELRVRVIDLCPDAPADAAARRIADELGGEPGCITAGYGPDGQRRIPQANLLNPYQYTPRNLDTWARTT
jgi:hypothetical protein